MKKIILFTICFITGIYKVATQNDEYTFSENIHRMVADSNSEYYYPKLMEKCRNEPQSLGAMDYYYLYYGQIFDEGHTGFSLVFQDKGSFERSVQRQKHGLVKTEGEKLLQQNPTDLHVLTQVSNSLQKGNLSDETGCGKRLQDLMTAILSTGNGSTYDSAIKVVHPTDDQVIKGYLGYLGGTQDKQYRDGKTYSVWTTDNGPLYFEILPRIN